MSLKPGMMDWHEYRDWIEDQFETYFLERGREDGMRCIADHTLELIGRALIIGSRSGAFSKADHKWNSPNYSLFTGDAQEIYYPRGKDPSLTPFDPIPE